MLRPIAVSILHRYPPPWRERYEGEVLSLIEESPVRFSDLGDLVRGLIVERARALMEDADHPQRTVAILGLTRSLCVVVFIGFAWAIGAALRTWPALQQSPEYLGPVLGTLWIAAFWPVVVFRSYRQGWSAYPQRPLFTARTGLVLLPVLFVVTAVAEWSFVETSYASVFSPGLQYGLNVFRNVFYHGFAAGILSAAFWPHHQLLQALSQLTNLDRAIASARTWVDGCLTMNALGVPSPLDEAQANVDRLSVERESVLARLRSLGYSARFR